ncbi:MAG: protein translocase subunit SecD [bacterium]|nr:protein translocase subunit SecD [bacterium]
MIKSRLKIYYLIIIVTVICFFIAVPTIPVKFNIGQYKVDTAIGGDIIEANFPIIGRIYKKFEFKKGLDIQGGVHVVLQADMKDISENDRLKAIESVKNVIERRVNLFGVSEPTIVTSKIGVGENAEYRVVVDMPGVSDTKEAISLIGETAQLEFRTLYEPVDGVEPPDGLIDVQGLGAFLSTDLNGKDLRRAEVVFNNSSQSTDSGPQVSLSFNIDGSKKFAKLTQDNLGKPIAIFLDDQIVSAPTVQSVIADGNAVISGSFTVEQANSLAIQLRAGALPVPVKIIEQQEIGPTLGQVSVNKTIIAGVIGFILVAIFMILNYGRLGLIANVALTIYVLIIVAIYKGVIPGLGSIVLNLPGLAGFLLSIGMAVDSNILIFERIREELLQKKPLGIAIERGFQRSWSSVRDANFATLITAFILTNPFNWNFLVTSGPVRGFAITLTIGVFVSLFTGVVVTRNLIRVFFKGVNI